MNKIAQGLQYTVYDMGNRRVLKIKTTLFEKVRILRSWNIRNPITIIRCVFEAYLITYTSIQGLKFVKNIDWSMFGNPTFFGLNYEQDKVTTLSDFFSSHTISENKLIIDALIVHIHNQWKYGMADTVYNFTVNNGVDASGSVILIDLGELTFDKEVVRTHITKKKWLTQWSFGQLEGGELKEYIEKSFASRLTIELLDVYWNKSAHDTQK